MTAVLLVGIGMGTAGLALAASQDYPGKTMIAVISTTGSLNFATGLSPYYHKDWKPIARLISAYYGIFVRQDSPYKTLGDLIVYYLFVHILEVMLPEGILSL